MKVTQPEHLVGQLAVPEGPAIWRGGVVFVEMRGGTVCHWSESTGVEIVATLGGGPNAVAVWADELYVTQNGGADGAWTSPEPREPAIVAVRPDGTVATAATAGDGLALRAPNDLVFGPDGVLYFTDPGRYDPEGPAEVGRIFALERDGTCRCLCETGPTFPNGIVLDSAGEIRWVESYTGAICRLSRGERDVMGQVGDGAVPDGLALAANGDMYIAATAFGTIEVFDAEGAAKGSYAAGVEPTNCCFDGHMLYVTDGGAGDRAGSLVRLPLNVIGQPLWAGEEGVCPPRI